MNFDESHAIDVFHGKPGPMVIVSLQVQIFLQISNYGNKQPGRANRDQAPSSQPPRRVTGPITSEIRFDACCTPSGHPLDLHKSPGEIDFHYRQATTWPNTRFPPDRPEPEPRQLSSNTDLNTFLNSREVRLFAQSSQYPLSAALNISQTIAVHCRAYCFNVSGSS